MYNTFIITPATCCTAASPTTRWTASSRSRTLPLGWWRALSNATSSHQLSASCIGFQCSKASSSRSPCTLVYQALSGHDPSYLTDNCCLVTNVRPRRLRSAETRMLLVSQTRSNCSDRAFSAAGSRVCDYLPTDLRQVDLSYSRFRHSLKTFYLVSETKAQFECSFNRALEIPLLAPLPFYLITYCINGPTVLWMSAFM